MGRALPSTWVHSSVRGVWQGALDDVTGSRPALELTVTLRLLRVLVINDFRQRYRGQALGIVWSILNPLVTMTVLSLVFGHLFRVQVPDFPIFVLLGIILWHFTTSAWSAATNSFVSHAVLVKSATFPRVLVPVAAVLSQLINLCVEAIAFLVIVPFFPGATRISVALLFVPVPLILLLAAILGAGLGTAVLQPRFRDVAFLVTTVQVLLYWVTPVFYPRAALPPVMKVALNVNPLTGLFEAVRGAVMKGELPPLRPFAVTAGLCIGILLMGVLLYRRHTRTLTDFL